MIGDIGGIMVVFVGAIENHGDDGEYQHDSFAMFAFIEYFC